MNGRVLAAEDNPVSRRLLVRTLETLGYGVTQAENGEEVLSHLRKEARAFDVVLLDIMMPVLDGYETLRQIKSDPQSRDLPVLMITAIDELDSVIHCIELGATDYLPKPFNADLLRARLEASLAVKRMRDLELEYLEQVAALTGAAAEVEAGSYDAARLDSVAQREDQLGNLARVFQRMVGEVRAREERLVKQVAELRIEIDEARQAQTIAEITESEFYQRISAEASELRQLIDG
jgi:CheY-like chemotaxis protein